jgi:hypothetical protein
MRYMNSLFIQNEDILRWNCGKKTREKKLNLDPAEVNAKEKMKNLTDHAQLNFYVSCWTLNKINSASIDPIVLALYIRYNK